MLPARWQLRWTRRHLPENGYHKREAWTVPDGSLYSPPPGSTSSGCQQGKSLREVSGAAIPARPHSRRISGGQRHNRSPRARRGFQARLRPAPVFEQIRPKGSGCPYFPPLTTALRGQPFRSDLLQRAARVSAFACCELSMFRFPFFAESFPAWKRSALAWRDPESGMKTRFDELKVGLQPYSAYPYPAELRPAGQSMEHETQYVLNWATGTGTHGVRKRDAPEGEKRLKSSTRWPGDQELAETSRKPPLSGTSLHRLLSAFLAFSSSATGPCQVRRNRRSFFSSSTSRTC